MTLKIDFNWRRCLKWAGWGLALLFLIVYVIRIVSFENYYYDAKDGSERAVVESANDIDVGQEELIEEEPTEAEVREYTVAADRPKFLTVEKLGINNARILPMGLTREGALDTPRNIFDVGWYEQSGKPGQGGTLVIDGHNGGPHVRGVFKNLPSLASGDVILITRGDNVVYKYVVADSVEVSLSDADAYMAKAMQSPVSGKESVTLISCTGEWSQQRGTYLSRQFVRAVLFEN